MLSLSGTLKTLFLYKESIGLTAQNTLDTTSVEFIGAGMENMENLG